MKAEIERRPQFPNQRRDSGDKPQAKQLSLDPSSTPSVASTWRSASEEVEVSVSPPPPLWSPTEQVANGAPALAVGALAWAPCSLIVYWCCHVCQCEYVNMLICFVHQHLTSIWQTRVTNHKSIVQTIAIVLMEFCIVLHKLQVAPLPCSVGLCSGRLQSQLLLSRGS